MMFYAKSFVTVNSLADRFFLVYTVPWQYRNVFAGTIAIGWQGYLSWLNRTDESRSNAEQRKEKKEQQAAQSTKSKPANNSKKGQKA